MARHLKISVFIFAVFFAVFASGSAFAGDGCCPVTGKTKAATKDATVKKASATAKPAQASGCTDRTSAADCASKCTGQKTPPCTSQLTSTTGGDVSQVTLGVAYMTCAGCAGTVSGALKKLDGVQSVAVDYKSGVADIEYTSSSMCAADLVKAIESVGYHAQVGPYSAEELTAFASGAAQGVSVTPASTTSKPAGCDPKDCPGHKSGS